MTERLPQRFRYLHPMIQRWIWGVCYPASDGYWIAWDERGDFCQFKGDPTEALDRISDGGKVEWIDNDNNWAGDVMERPGTLDELDNYKSPPFPSAGTRKVRYKENQ